jgi:hypothetical protein
MQIRYTRYAMQGERTAFVKELLSVDGDFVAAVSRKYEVYLSASCNV